MPSGRPPPLPELTLILSTLKELKEPETALDSWLAPSCCKEGVACWCGWSCDSLGGSAGGEGPCRGDCCSPLVSKSSEWDEAGGGEGDWWVDIWGGT